MDVANVDTRMLRTTINTTACGDPVHKARFLLVMRRRDGPDDALVGWELPSLSRGPSVAQVLRAPMEVDADEWLPL